jgi:sugar transferase (PEP-CTERM system associated)
VPLAVFSAHYLLCALVEFVLLAGAFFGAAFVRFGADAFTQELIVVKALVGVLVLQAAFFYGELYENQGMRRRVELFQRLAQCFAAGAVVLIVVTYAFDIQLGRGVLAMFAAMGFSAVLAWRLVFLWAFGQEALSDRVLVLGTGQNAQRLAREMLQRAPLGYRVLGFLTEHTEEVGRKLVNPSVLGTVDDLPQLVESRRATLIVVAQADRRQAMPVAELLRCKLGGVRVMEEAELYERMTGKILLKDLRPSYFIFSDGFSKPRLLRNAKQVVEAVLAALGLVLAFPVLALVALAVRLSSPGPILYRQTRVGERGRPFPLLKFRTMRADAESKSGPVWASKKGDPRITPVGRFLRKTRLDELPQLINVVRSEMSFVGPRPERPHFVEKLGRIIPYYDERHSVRPGITGWAQVRFPYGSTIEDAEEKLQYDLYYIKHMSPVLDLAIIFETAKVALLGRGAR